MNQEEFNGKFDTFITKWCSNMSAHLLDDDENDGQALRDFVADNYIRKQKVIDAIIKFKSRSENTWTDTQIEDFLKMELVL